MNLVTEKACFNMELRLVCRIIAIYYLISLVISSILSPGYFSSSRSLIGFAIIIVANICLYFGAQKNYQYLVLVWSIQGLLFLIGFPIAILGIILNFGDFRQTSYFDNVFLIILEYIIEFVIFLWLARYVYSFWHQLRNSQTRPQHSVVV